MAKNKPFPWTRPSSLAAFGATIRRQRELLIHTLDTLASVTGISKPYLSNIETARSPGPPSPEKLRRLAAALQLDEQDLLAAADWLRTPVSVRNSLTAMATNLQSQSAPVNSANSTSDLKRELQTASRRPDGTIDLDHLLQLKTFNRTPDENPSPTGAAHLPDASNNSAAAGTGRARAKRSQRGSAPPSGNPDTQLLPVRPVPVINRVAAGKATEFTDLDYPAGIADSYVAAPDLPEAPVGAAFAVRIRGDSMAPDYVDGEILIVGPSDSASSDAGPLGPHDGEDCVVRLGELDHFATTFKRIFYERDAAGQPIALRLVPLNPAHSERRVSLEQVTGIYPLMYRLVKPARPLPFPTNPPPTPKTFTTTRVAIEND